MILQMYINDRREFNGKGYIAGTADGIVTVAGKAASRAICLYALYNYKPMVLVAKTWSTAQGNYMFSGLDTSMRYLVIVRDYAGRYEPFAWDQVEPATDLTLHEQYLLERSWR